MVETTAAVPESNAKDPLIGTPAPEWTVRDWIGSQPLTLDDLRGRVVLVRWWTGPGCPYCKASAPSLNEFHREYGASGLVVVGLYHHKSRAPFSREDVEKLANEFDFEFPVAIDYDWRTLREWWLETGERDFTSVTFLLDRQGSIRHIHPGGQYVKGDPAHELMRQSIETLLEE